MAKVITGPLHKEPKPKKTRQGNSENTKWGHKGSKKYKKRYKGQGK